MCIFIHRFLSILFLILPVNTSVVYFFESNEPEMPRDPVRFPVANDQKVDPPGDFQLPHSDTIPSQFLKLDVGRIVKVNIDGFEIQKIDSKKGHFGQDVVFDVGKPKLFPFHDSLAAGKYHSLASEGMSYIVKDARVGDQIVMQTFRENGADFLVEFAIERRVGEKLPPSQLAKTVKVPWHIHVQAMNDYKDHCKRLPDIVRSKLPSDVPGVQYLTAKLMMITEEELKASKKFVLLYSDLYGKYTPDPPAKIPYAK